MVLNALANPFLPQSEKSVGLKALTCTKKLTEDIYYTTGGKDFGSFSEQLK